MTRSELDAFIDSKLTAADGTKITAAEHREVEKVLADYAEEVAAGSAPSIDGRIVGVADTSKTFSNLTDYPLYDAAKLNVYKVTEAGDYNTFAGTTGNTDLVVSEDDVNLNVVEIYRQSNGTFSKSLTTKVDYTLADITKTYGWGTGSTGSNVQTSSFLIWNEAYVATSGEVLTELHIYSPAAQTMEFKVVNIPNRTAGATITIKETFTKTLTVGLNVFNDLNIELEVDDALALQMENGKGLAYTEGGTHTYANNITGGNYSPVGAYGFISYVWKTNKEGGYALIVNSESGLSHERITIEGQSNALGVGYTAPLASAPFNTVAFDYLNDFGRVFIFNPATSNYERLNIGSNNQASWDAAYLDPSGTPTAESFGPELGIAIQWLNVNPKGLLFIDKNTGDGKPISHFTTSGYLTTTSNRRTAANAWLENRGLKVREAGYLWVQGEGNMADSSASYKAALDSLIDQRKTDKVIESDTIIAIAQIHTSNANYGAGVATAKAEWVGENKNARLITYTNNTIADNIHLNTTGQMQLGFDAAMEMFVTDKEVTTAMPVGKANWNI